MTDPYLQFANSALGRPLVSSLGLPRPVVLKRHRAGDPLLDGPLLLSAAKAGGADEIGSTGKVGASLLATVLSFCARAKLDVCTLENQPVWLALASQTGLNVRPYSPQAGTPAAALQALVFDASTLAHPEELEQLYSFFHDSVRRLNTCGRVLLLGRPPQDCSTSSQAITQRALEGLSRSLGKELGRGICSQLVYVAEGAEPGLESTLRFLLSPRSAYVSGQVIHVAAPMAMGIDPLEINWDQPLAGQRALITGAAQGIGAAIAEVLARDGAQVICLDIPQAATPLAGLTQSLGAQALELDIASPEAPAELQAKLQALGGIDILVHNAGITRDKTIANMKRDQWQQVMDINLCAQERINSALLESHSLHPGGAIICLSSISGIAGNRGQTNYATSKAGVIGLVESQAARLAAQGISINAVAPGLIETRMTAAMPFFVRTAARLMNSMQQGGQVRDVAETVAWLAAPASRGLTGNIVRVCGQSLIGA